MDSSESAKGESLNEAQLNKYSQLEVSLKKRNKMLRHEEDNFDSYPQHDDVDLSDHLQTIPQKSANDCLQKNENIVVQLRDDVAKQKRTSELKMDFTIEQGNQDDDEIDMAMENLRKLTNSVFKRIANVQSGFNECLNSNTGLMATVPKDKYIKMHEKLVMQTCALDRGIESVYRFPKDQLKKHVDIDLNVTTVDEFRKTCNELEQGILSTVYEEGVKISKNHEHLLEIKQYNNTSAGLSVEISSDIEKIDPYTRKIITRPVTNTICKHVYDQESVDLMFRNKHFISCPYIGCGNKRITKKDLIHDEIDE